MFVVPCLAAVNSYTLLAFRPVRHARPGAVDGVDGLLFLEPERFAACDSHCPRVMNKCECERARDCK